jgi:hypothetical protein
VTIGQHLESYQSGVSPRPARYLWQFVKHAERVALDDAVADISRLLQFGQHHADRRLIRLRRDDREESFRVGDAAAAELAQYTRAAFLFLAMMCSSSTRTPTGLHAGRDVHVEGLDLQRSRR